MMSKVYKVAELRERWVIQVTRKEEVLIQNTGPVIASGKWFGTLVGPTRSFVGRSGPFCKEGPDYVRPAKPGVTLAGLFTVSWRLFLHNGYRKAAQAAG